MLWACVAACGTGNISLIERRMNSVKCPHIPEANIMPSVEKAADGKSRRMILHTPEKPIMDDLKSLELKDGNVVEHLWIGLKRAVCAGRPSDLTEGRMGESPPA